MCFFVSFLPATIWLVIGYFVLFASSRAEGSIKTFGRGLAIWAFVLSAFILLGGAYVALSGLCPLGAIMNSAG